MSANLVFEKPDTKIVVARFTRPDVREALYHYGHEHDDIGESTLYREFHAGAVEGLPDGGILVLNFGLVDAFSSAFYRFLLRARQDLKAKNARLILCAFTPHGQEAFSIMGGPKTFEVYPTESQALAEAKK